MADMFQHVSSPLWRIVVSQLGSHVQYFPIGVEMPKKTIQIIETCWTIWTILKPCRKSIVVPSSQGLCNFDSGRWTQMEEHGDVCPHKYRGLVPSRTTSIDQKYGPTHKHRSGTSWCSIFQPYRIPTLPLSTTSFAQVCSGPTANVEKANATGKTCVKK